MSTVFVLGAGASAEAKLPVGDELTRGIAKDLASIHRPVSSDRAYTIQMALQVLGSEMQLGPQGLFVAAELIAKAMPLASSIDNFVDMHRGEREIEACSKVAIVAAILEAERRSAFYVDEGNIYNTIQFENAGGTWHKLFFQRLTENCAREQLESRMETVGFVIFNYDRCLEHYLLHALSIAYGLEQETAASLIARIPILHPYGMAGRLPWQQGQASVANFGGAPDARQLVHLSRSIKTFTEQFADNDHVVSGIRKMLSGATRIVFLGFAFHRQNMKLLSLKVNGVTEPKMTSRCFGTTYNFSQSDTEIIAAEITDEIGPIRQLIELRKDLTCTQLFTEYSKNLSLNT